MKIQKQKGITLIVTIIILLILAGVTISTLAGDNGLFVRAKQEKLDTKRSQIVEWLNLKLLEEQAKNSSGKAEEIIIATRQNVIDNQSELEKMGKQVTIEETSTEEDGEQVEIYFYVVVDKDVYKVDLKVQVL